MKGDLVGVRDSAKDRFGEIVGAAQDAANVIEFGSIWPRMTHEMAADMARMADSSIGSIGRVVGAAARAEEALDRLEKKREASRRSSVKHNERDLKALRYMEKAIQDRPHDASTTWRTWDFSDPDNPIEKQGLYDWARARGGPVTAGRPYMVGERGPEVFTPSASGSILPNGLTAESIGAAVARALQRNPPVVSQSPVTDSVMRAWPRQQALRGYA